MNQVAACLKQEKDGVSLLIRVQPKASRTRLCGRHGEAIKIAVTAPPVDGKANAAIIKFLAKLFKLPKSAVTIKSGQQGRDKRLLLTGIPLAEAERIIESCLRQ